MSKSLKLKNPLWFFIRFKSGLPMKVFNGLAKFSIGKTWLAEGKPTSYSYRAYMDFDFENL